MVSTPERLPAGPLTYEDYAAIPDDGNRYEILDGELAVSPSPSSRHQRVSINLLFILLSHVRKYGLGQIFHAPIDVILAETTLLQPDILFVAKERESIVTERGVEGPPDLVVEIVSPGSARQDRTTKAAPMPASASGTIGSSTPTPR